MIVFHPESNVTLIGLLHAFGASIQDVDTNVVIKSPAPSRRSNWERVLQRGND